MDFELLLGPGLLPALCCGVWGCGAVAGGVLLPNSLEQEGKCSKGADVRVLWSTCGPHLVHGVGREDFPGKGMSKLNTEA